MLYQRAVLGRGGVIGLHQAGDLDPADADIEPAAAPHAKA